MQEESDYRQAEFEPVRLQQIARTSEKDLYRVLEAFRLTLADIELRLTAFLRSSVTLQIVSTEELNKAVEHQKPAIGGQLISLSLPDQLARAVITLGPPLIALLLDLILGGDGSRVEPLGRACTDLEKSLLRPVHETFAQGVASLAGSKYAVISEEVPEEKDGCRQGSGRRIVFVVAMACLELNDLLRISIPLDWVVKPESVQPGAEAPATELPIMILEALENSPIEVDSVLSGITIRIEDLLSLQPDDVLILDCPTAALVHLKVNGLSQMSGRLGEQNGRRALLIDSVS